MLQSPHLQKEIKIFVLSLPTLECIAECFNHAQGSGLSTVHTLSHLYFQMKHLRLRDLSNLAKITGSPRSNKWQSWSLSVLERCFEEKWQGSSASELCRKSVFMKFLLVNCPCLDWTIRKTKQPWSCSSLRNTKLFVEEKNVILRPYFLLCIIQLNSNFLEGIGYRLLTFLDKETNVI